MNVHDATEQAYRNGYEQGFKKGKANAVIHCKDCDHSVTLQMGLYSPVQRFCHLGGYFKSVSDTDFCSWAKKGTT